MKLLVVVVSVLFFGFTSTIEKRHCFRINRIKRARSLRSRTRTISSETIWWRQSSILQRCFRLKSRAFKENIFSSLNNEFEMRFRFPYPLIYIRDQLNGNGRDERSGKEQMRIKRGKDMTKTRFMQAAFETLQIALFILNFTKPHTWNTIHRCVLVVNSDVYKNKTPIILWWK